MVWGKRAQQEARKRGGIISSKNLGEKALKPKICPGDKRVLIDQKRKRTLTHFLVFRGCLGPTPTLPPFFSTSHELKGFPGVLNFRTKYYSAELPVDAVASVSQSHWSARVLIPCFGYKQTLLFIPACHTRTAVSPEETNQEWPHVCFNALQLPS